MSNRRRYSSGVPHACPPLPPPTWARSVAGGGCQEDKAQKSGQSRQGRRGRAQAPTWESRVRWCGGRLAAARAAPFFFGCQGTSHQRQGANFRVEGNKKRGDGRGAATSPMFSYGSGYVLLACLPGVRHAASIIHPIYVHTYITCTYVIIASPPLKKRYTKGPFDKRERKRERENKPPLVQTLISILGSFVRAWSLASFLTEIRAFCTHTHVVA